MAGSVNCQPTTSVCRYAELAPSSLAVVAMIASTVTELQYNPIIVTRLAYRNGFCMKVYSSLFPTFQLFTTS